MPVVRSKRSSLIDDQPVYCTSAITSQRSFSWWKIETLAISGSSIFEVTPPLYSALVLMPAVSWSTTGCSAGDTIAVGLSKLALPLSVYLIEER